MRVNNSNNRSLTMSDPKRVLVVEDDQQIAEAIEIRMRSAGYDVVRATDGIAAMATARNVHPDTILLDLRLPKVGGLEVLDNLHKDAGTKEIPVIVVSASAVDSKRAIDRGARYFFEKPYDAKRLVAAVDAVVTAEQAAAE